MRTVFPCVENFTGKSLCSKHPSAEITIIVRMKHSSDPFLDSNMLKSWKLHKCMNLVPGYLTWPGSPLVRGRSSRRDKKFFTHSKEFLLILPNLSHWLPRKRAFKNFPWWWVELVSCWRQLKQKRLGLSGARELKELSLNTIVRGIMEFDFINTILLNDIIQGTSSPLLTRLFSPKSQKPV